MSVERQLMMSSGGVTQMYPISNSLRFRSSASAYLSRTPASSSNRQTWSWSCWGKLGAISTLEAIFSAGDGTINNEFLLYVTSAGAIGIQQTVGATSSGQISCVTNALFRDPSAWYHIVLSIDTTQTTAANRLVLYVNGVSQSFSSYNVGASINTWVNNTNAHAIGKRADASLYFDGYLAEINFIDGQALTPSSFGETSSTTGVWIPKKYTGSYGTNGFYLSFNNNTSTTALGYDTSGNGNNWTPNNFSLTTGSTYDSMIDSPTSYASGVNNVGNYCVLNPVDTGGGSVTLSGANLDYTIASGTGSQVRGSVGSGLTGKWYWESVNGTLATPISPVAFGLSTTNGQITNNSSSLRKAVIIYTDAGTGYTASYYLNGSATTISTQFRSAAIGDIFQVAYDADTGKVWFGKNNTWYDGSNGTSGNPSTGANPVFTIATGDPMTPLLVNLGATYSGSLNCGQRPFAYTPPTGYKALNTQNLPAPSIQNGANFMAATLYTGTGATNLTVANANNSVSFQPGFVWIKKRGPGTANHCLNNEVMGVGTGVSLYTASTSVAGAYDIYGYLSALTSTGFTTQKGTDPTYPNDLVNESGSTYVAWQWKAGGTAVTNTAGSITSSVSANPTAGFSVVTWTNPSSGNPTIGHGLGIAPVFVIVKSRTTAYNWDVGCTSIGWVNRLILNSTSATSSGFWNSTAPTSSVFTYSASGASSSDLMVAYCFAAIPGYSAFGSYTGNGSTDGPFIYLGFRPRFIMYKRTDSAADWVILDSSRDAYNQQSLYLLPDSSSAELDYTSSYPMDFVSNGWKIRQNAAGGNASGGTYIYAAFAESPFKFSLAR